MAKKAPIDPLVRPYLKWAGGKRQLMPEIQRTIPRRYTTYYEPFVGAGALLFAIQPRRAVINDHNEQLIVTYMAIRDDVEALIALLKTHKENTSQEYFYEIRSLDRDAEAFAALSPVEKAARLIYLNKTCFNGLYRVNLQGLFNVPYGRHFRRGESAGCQPVSERQRRRHPHRGFCRGGRRRGRGILRLFRSALSQQGQHQFYGISGRRLRGKRADPAARRLRRAERTGRQVPAQQRGHAFHPGAVPRLYDQNGHGQPGNQRQRQRAGAGQRSSD